MFVLYFARKKKQDEKKNSDTKILAFWFCELLLILVFLRKASVVVLGEASGGKNLL